MIRSMMNFLYESAGVEPGQVLILGVVLLVGFSLAVIVAHSWLVSLADMVGPV